MLRDRWRGSKIFEIIGWVGVGGTILKFQGRRSRPIGLSPGTATEQATDTEGPIVLLRFISKK